MIAYVCRNVGEKAAKSGPHLGELTEFLTKHGIPVFYFAEEDVWAGEGFEQEKATPGMVGIGWRDNMLYTVLKDGSVSALPLQVVNIENEYPRQPRRTSEQTEQLRRQEQQAPALR